MAQVPQAQPQSQALAPLRTNAPQAAPTAEAAGAGAQQEQAAAGSVLKTAQSMQIDAANEANEARLVELRNAANQWELDNVYGPKGAINRRGKDAFGVQEDLNKSFNSFMADQSKTLVNDSQRKGAQQFALARLDQYDNWAQRHTAEQVEAYKKALFADSVESSKTRAAANPSSVATEQAFIDRQVVQNFQGFDPETVNRELQKNRSDMYLRVLSNMTASKDYKTAQKFYDAHESEMDGDVKLNHILPMLAEQRMRTDAATKSDSILSQSGSLAEALPKVDAIKDPEVKKRVTQDVREHFSLRTAALEELQKTNMINASNILQQTPNMAAVPPALLTPLLPTQRAELEARAKQISSGTAPSTDWGLYYELRGQAGSKDEKDAFMKTNLMQYRSKLADSEFKELTSLQDGQKKGDRVVMDKLAGYDNKFSVVRSAMNQAGLDVNADPKTDEGKYVINVRRMVDTEEADTVSASGGKPLTPAQYNDIVSRVMVKSLTDPSSYFKRKMAAYQVLPGQNFGVDIKDIPSKDKAEIVRSLSSRGLPTDDQAVIHLYMDNVNRLVGK